MAKEKKKLGGFRPGAGRPRVPKAERAIAVSITLTPEKLSRLDALAKEKNLSRSALIAEWIR